MSAIHTATYGPTLVCLNIRMSHVQLSACLPFFCSLTEMHARNKIEPNYFTDIKFESNNSDVFDFLQDEILQNKETAFEIFVNPRSFQELHGTG
jgi:hypothetical protein